MDVLFDYHGHFYKTYHPDVFPATPLATVVNVVETDGNNASYGAQRILGSLGMITFSGVWAADNYNYSGISHYTAVFRMYVPLC